MQLIILLHTPMKSFMPNKEFDIHESSFLRPIPYYIILWMDEEDTLDDNLILMVAILWLCEMKYQLFDTSWTSLFYLLIYLFVYLFR